MLAQRRSVTTGKRRDTSAGKSLTAKKQAGTPISTPKPKPKPKPAWNSYLTDGNRFKATEKEVLEKKKLMVSPHNCLISNNDISVRTPKSPMKLTSRLHIGKTPSKKLFSESTASTKTVFGRSIPHSPIFCEKTQTVEDLSSLDLLAADNSEENRNPQKSHSRHRATTASGTASSKKMHATNKTGKSDVSRMSARSHHNQHYRLEQQQQQQVQPHVLHAEDEGVLFSGGDLLEQSSNDIDLLHVEADAEAEDSAFTSFPRDIHAVDWLGAADVANNNNNNGNSSAVNAAHVRKLAQGRRAETIAREPPGSLVQGKSSRANKSHNTRSSPTSTTAGGTSNRGVQLNTTGTNALKLFDKEDMQQKATEIRALFSELRYYEELAGKRSILETSEEVTDLLQDETLKNPESHRQLLQHLIDVTCKSLTYLLQKEVALQQSRTQQEVLENRVCTLNALLNEGSHAGYSMAVTAGAAQAAVSPGLASKGGRIPLHDDLLNGTPPGADIYPTTTTRRSNKVDYLPTGTGTFAPVPLPVDDRVAVAVGDGEYDALYSDSAMAPHQHSPPAHRLTSATEAAQITHIRTASTSASASSSALRVLAQAYAQDDLYPVPSAEEEEEEEEEDKDKRGHGEPVPFLPLSPGAAGGGAAGAGVVGGSPTMTTDSTGVHTAGTKLASPSPYVDAYASFYPSTAAAANATVNATTNVAAAASKQQQSFTTPQRKRLSFSPDVATPEAVVASSSSSAAAAAAAGTTAVSSWATPPTAAPTTTTTTAAAAASNPLQKLDALIAYSKLISVLPPSPSTTQQRAQDQGNNAMLSTIDRLMTHHSSSSAQQQQQQQQQQVCRGGARDAGGMDAMYGSVDSLPPPPPPPLPFESIMPPSANSQPQQPLTPARRPVAATASQQRTNAMFSQLVGSTAATPPLPATTTPTTSKARALGGMTGSSPSDWLFNTAFTPSPAAQKTITNSTGNDQEGIAVVGHGNASAMTATPKTTELYRSSKSNEGAGAYTGGTYNAPITTTTTTTTTTSSSTTTIMQKPSGIPVSMTKQSPHTKSSHHHHHDYDYGYGVAIAGGMTPGGMTTSTGLQDSYEASIERLVAQTATGMKQQLPIPHIPSGTTTTTTTTISNTATPDDNNSSNSGSSSGSGPDEESPSMVVSLKAIPSPHRAPVHPFTHSASNDGRPVTLGKATAAMSAAADSPPSTPVPTYHQHQRYQEHHPQYQQQQQQWQMRPSPQRIYDARAGSY